MTPARDRWSYVTHTEEETRRVGATLGRLLAPGDVIALTGPLGAGKTRLVQGIAQGLDIDRPITSPTFILMNLYPGSQGRTLCHIDCYRMRDPVEEGYDLGLDQQLGGEDICVVEWAERIAPLLPTDHLAITIEPLGDHRRRLTFQARGPRSRALLEALAAHLDTDRSTEHARHRRKGTGASS